RRREKHLSVRILALKRGLEPLGQRLIRGMVAQEPPSHLKHHFEAIALQRGSADGRIAKISNWRVGSNGTIYNPPAICERCPMSEIGSNSVIRRRKGMAGFMSTRPSTTLADLLRPPLVANSFSTMRASLRR